MQSAEFRRFATVHDATDGEESDDDCGASERSAQLVIARYDCASSKDNVRAGSAIYEMAGMCSEVDIWTAPRRKQGGGF